MKAEPQEIAALDSPPPPADEGADSVRLEQPTRLSESVLWDLQRADFEARGVAAWSQAAVPHIITSNAFVAHAYVRQVRAFMRDVTARGLVDPAQPLYVVELAAGSGRLGFGFLNAWLEASSDAAVAPAAADGQLCYVLSDVSDSALELWQRHPQLVALAERGALDFARFDPESDDSLHLLRSGVELAPGTVKNPLVVIANHAFHSLRHDAFAVVDGQLLECRLTLDVPAEALEGDGPSLDALRVGHDYRPVDLPYYQDEVLDGLLEEYRRELRTGHPLLPIGAFRAVRALADLAEGGLLLLSADIGTVHPAELRDTPPPRPGGHGSLAFRVNYHALGRQVEALGGRVFKPGTTPAQLAANAYLFGVDGELPATRRAVTEALDGLGPDAFLVLQRRLDPHFDAMPLQDVLAYLKLARWDTGAARRCLPRLGDLAAAGLARRQRDAVADATERIWAGHLHLGEVFDLAFELGTVLLSAFLHRRAIELFKCSLERYGEHTATFFNLALCHFRLRQWDLARRCAARALELDGDNAGVRDLSQKIDAAERGDPAAGDPVAQVGAVVAAKAAPPTTGAYASNLEHLQGELALLNLRLRAEIERWRASHPPAASLEELQGSRLTDLGADLALDGLGDARELLVAAGGDPFASLAPRAALHARREGAALRAGVALKLPELARRMGLDDFERAVVVLALAPELDHRYERLFGYLNDDMQRRWPTVRLALRLFTASPEERNARAWTLDGEAPLSRHRLLRIAAEERPFPMVDGSRGLRLEGRTLGFLLDKPSGFAADPVLAPFLERHDGDGAEPALGEAAVRAEIEGLRAVLADRPQPTPILVLDGPDGRLMRQVAAYLGGDDRLLVLRGAAVATAEDPEELIARALREVELTGAALLVEDAAALRAEGRPTQALRRLLAADGSRPRRLPRLLASAEPWPLPETGAAAPVITLHVPAPDQAAREELWRRGLGELAEGLDLAQLAGRFRLRSAQIEGAADHVRARFAGQPPEDLAAEMFAACRARCVVSFDGLAERVDSVHTWDDLIVPAAVKEKLRAIENWLRCRHVVYDDWGFAERVSVGRGMAAMFAGSSGTGKTMAAGILGRVLDLDIYRIDLSSVVSKYIGETEKNLARVFDAAEVANAILFFDEADALFGKRTEVKDSHDRHANLEVSYLLQRMESYDGIAILATNLKNNLDLAFARRLQAIVEFPFPKPAEREQIWRRLLPRQVPQAADVDLGFLAEHFAFSGGSIKNCAMGAALAAAAEQRPLAMRHLVPAVAREYEKLGKQVSAAAFGEYAGLVG